MTLPCLSVCSSFCLTESQTWPVLHSKSHLHQISGIDSIVRATNTGEKSLLIVITNECQIHKRLSLRESS